MKKFLQLSLYFLFCLVVNSAYADTPGSSSSSSSFVPNAIAIDIQAENVDNHKVFEFGTKVAVSVSRQGACWNSASTISFSFSGAQLYFSDDTPVNSGQSYSFASLPSLYLIAAGPSSTWDKVMISATAYPNHNLNSGSGYSDSGYGSCKLLEFKLRFCASRSLQRRLLRQ